MMIIIIIINNNNLIITSIINYLPIMRDIHKDDLSHITYKFKIIFYSYIIYG